MIEKMAKSPVKVEKTPEKRENLSPAEVVKRSKPYRILFTKVTGIDEKYNRNALDIQGEHRN